MRRKKIKPEKCYEYKTGFYKTVYLDIDSVEEIRTYKYFHTTSSVGGYFNCLALINIIN